jgi:predicted dehydrogenase
MRLRDGGVGQLAISMACPVDYRRGCCSGANGFATWDICAGEVTIQLEGEAAPRHRNFGAISTVIEGVYLDEINRFVDAVLGKERWPQSYTHAQLSSATLAAAERSHVTGRWTPVDPAEDPEEAPPSRA